MEQKESKSPRIARILVAFALLGGAIWLGSKAGDISDIVVGLNYEPTAEIAQMVDEIKLTDKGMRILKASLPELQEAENFNVSCPSNDADTSILGCYYDRKIYIFDVDSDELNGVHQSTLAHELLHAIWERHPDDEIAKELGAVYQKYHDELSEHMSHYDDASQTDELHSVIGTQLEDDKLSEKLRAHYDEYFKDRSEIVRYYRLYEGKFTELKEQNAQLKEKIDAMTAEIEMLSDEYEQTVDTLNHDIDIFNSRARNGYYSDNASFQADRTRLLDRQVALDDDYELITQKVNEVNALIEKYNENVNHSNELYGSINSKVKAPEEALGE